MLIPVRGGHLALALEYDFQGLVDRHPDLNRTMEEAWASLLSVVAESWPDWPIEVWSNLSKVEAVDPDDPESLPTWRLGYRVTFSGQDASNPDVAAMVAFITQGLGKVVDGDPEVSWAGISPGWRALWVVDDTQVFRMIADTQTIESSVWMLGHYAGEPEYFAATFEAWPLRHAGLPIERAEADLGWAFSF
jgi:hypothetical protein